MKNIIRWSVFVLTLCVIFVSLAYYGLNVNEELGGSLLVVGAFLIAVIVTMALSAVVGWLFTDNKPNAMSSAISTPDTEQKNGNNSVDEKAS